MQLLALDSCSRGSGASVTVVAHLYSRMIVGWPTAIVFPDEGNGDLWEPRRGALGSIEVWLQHPDGSSILYATVMNAMLESIAGVEVTDGSAG